MKKLILMTVLLSSFARITLAAPTVVFHDGYGSEPNGGEFQAELSTGWTFLPIDLPGGYDPGFETFSLERSEYIQFGTTYYVGFSDAAIFGGVGGQDPPGSGMDPLDPMTAYLYSQFITGTLSGYDYGISSGRVASADALQNTIWYIENEIAVLPGGLATTFYNNAYDAVHGPSPTWSGLGTVQVMNVYSSSTLEVGAAQDQLVMRAIPAPGAVLLAVPNGGEVLTAGSTYPITWSSEGTISDVLIEYSTDNGGDWSSIVTVPNTGSYDWLVPVVDSNQCLVRISDVNNADVNDMSNGVFTIQTVVTVPNAVGLEQAAAEAAITSGGLAVGTIGHTFSLTVPAGSVISQDPNAGTSVVPGSGVDLLVSLGQPPVAVPNVVLLDSYDRGCYEMMSGGPRLFNGTFLAYPAGEVDSEYYRNWFVFDLSSVHSTIISAQLRLDGGEVAFRSNAPTLTYTLFDVPSPNNFSYSDLGTGTVYGSVDVSAAADGGVVTVNLNSDALTYLNSEEGLVAMGGWITTLGNSQGGDEWLFGTTGENHVTRLVLTISEPNYSILYVDNDAPNDPGPGDPCVPDPNEDGSPEHPFDSIQEGINAAFDGDTVTVLNGIYYENINFIGKNIILTSTAPSDQNVIAGTVIDGNQSGSVITFSGSEDTNCVLTGFTVMNGNAWVGGGIWGWGTEATISNCVISGNSSSVNDFGGGPQGGGGLYHCNGPIINCIINDNSTGLEGGGLCWCHGPIINCIINGNTAGHAGGGLDHCNGPIINCIINGNTAGNAGGGLDYCNGPIINCIIWANTGSQVDSSVTPTYSCIQDWTSGGEGNITTDPCFVDVDSNDLHLRPNSPCINAGDPNYVLDPNYPTDLDGNPRVIGGRIDMGAYEYVPSANDLPDLKITSEDISFVPIPGVPAQPVTISATVSNIGVISAEGILVFFTDSNGLIGSNTIPSLDPDQSETVSIQHSWPEAGYQLITVTVNPDGSGRGRGDGDGIEELDETNNTASKVYQIGYPEDANAILEVSWNSAPACYTEGTSAVIQGKADYRIEITGADDIVSAALGSIVTAQMIDSNGIVTNLQSAFTGPDGYFYIPFIVPGADYGSFTIEISVTDGTLTGEWEKLFCIKIDPDNPDLWICDLTLSDETPDIDDVVAVCATVCASPDNGDTLFSIPVTFYAYPPTGGSYQIGSTVISQMAPGESEEVCVNWTPTVNGPHRITAIIGPGYSDDNNGNNSRYYNVTVGMFNVSASPRWTIVGQQVQITIDSREPLPSDQLDSIAILDSTGQPIPFSPADPCHPLPTRWIYQTDALPAGTALGTANITVTGTDSNSVQHTGEGYFEVYEIMPDFWLHSCDISFSNLNPALGEPITIDAVVHADSSNPETESDIPVTFYSQHLPSGGDYIQISQTQYTDEIIPGGVSTPVSVPWQNAAKGEYVIKVQLGPGFSDADNGNNAATRALLVGENIPFEVKFEFVSKTRTGRTEFEYECNVRMYNQTGLTLENVQLELTGVSSNMTLVAPPYTGTFSNIDPNGSALSENTCTFRVDRSEIIESGQIEWDSTYQIVDICGIQQQASTSVILFDPIVLGDITGEGEVNSEDLKQMAEDWLQSGSLADIYPPPYGDGVVDFRDFALLAENWGAEL